MWAKESKSWEVSICKVTFMGKSHSPIYDFFPSSSLVQTQLTDMREFDYDRMISTYQKSQTVLAK